MRGRGSCVLITARFRRHWVVPRTSIQSTADVFYIVIVEGFPGYLLVLPDCR